ncbi:MAG: hypothetical protein HY236_13665, partial [Acidobacteria bacterium]|nr:hypothetical protein [Acidobacteriota bacterium]
QAGWKCDTCRRLGLEKKRGCGWLEGKEKGDSPVVWLWQNPGRPGDTVATTECPVSYVSADSMALLEDFYAHQALGRGEEILRWPARRVDAFALLKAELRKTEPGANGKQ